MSHARALVIEDDHAACEALQKALTLMGHEVRCAHTVFRGLRELAAFRPNHVLLDLRFPDGSGTEILSAVRQQQLPIRVALMSADTDSDDWREASALRPDAVFRKPWNLNEIIAWFGDA